MFTPDSVYRNQEIRIGTIVQSDASIPVVILKDDKFNSLITISLHLHDPVAVFPAVGEKWAITRRGGTDWFLWKRMDTPTDQLPFSALDSGDTKICASGKLYLVAETIVLSGTVVNEQLSLSINDNHTTVNNVSHLEFSGATVVQNTDGAVVNIPSLSSSSTDASILITNPSSTTTNFAIARYPSTYAIYQSNGQTWATGVLGSNLTSFSGTASDSAGWFQKFNSGGTNLVKTVVAGLYSIQASVQFNGTPDNTKYVYINVAANNNVSATFPLYQVGLQPVFRMGLVDWCNKGNYVNVRLAHDYGSTQPFYVFLSIAKII